MSISWMALDALRLPVMSKYRGSDDFEALAAISTFTGTVAFDLSGTLVWPFGQNLVSDFSVAMPAETPSDVMDTVAQKLWLSNAEIMVQCAGDIDSVAVLAAICKNAPDLSKITVRYTKAGVARYPALFNIFLPNLGVNLENRDGLPLVGNSTTAYVDGRSGDDWQAGYLRSQLSNHRELLESGTLAQAIELVVAKSFQSLEYAEASRRGLARFIENSPMPIDTPWSFFVALYRFCVTQSDSLNGVIMEENNLNAFTSRRAFYDDPVFNAASYHIAGRGILALGDDSLELRQYCLSYFGDTEWFENERPVGTYYIYRLGKFGSHWLDDQGNARIYSELSFFAKPSTESNINHWRELHKRSPVVTSFGLFDADNDADKNFEEMIEFFDGLPTLIDGKLTWKLADNSFLPLTKIELTQVYSEIGQARAGRGALLHVKAEQFKQMNPRPLMSELSSIDFWLSPS